VLVTTGGGGIIELNRSTGLLVRTIVPSIPARFVEFVRRGSNADVAIQKTAASTTAFVGSTVSFTLTASVLGTEAANTIEVLDALPASLSFIGSNCGATLSGNTVSWQIATLAAGSNLTCTLQTQVRSSGTIVNTATIRAEGVDPVPSNNQASVSLDASALQIPTLSSASLLVLMLAIISIGLSLSRRR
jgi:uncharacterized repeat protein (TIGR01451 family)